MFVFVLARQDYNMLNELCKVNARKYVFTIRTGKSDQTISVQANLIQLLLSLEIVTKQQQ